MTVSRKKALFVIDAQPATLVEETKKLIPEIAAFITSSAYDAYIETTYYADEHSMFYKQGGFLLSQEDAGLTAAPIKSALKAKLNPHFFVSKTTRSCFKAHNSGELLEFLNRNQIEETHFVGFDINDCVLASAYESIDLGFFTYVIDHLCHHWEGDEILKVAAQEILKRQSMLMKSCPAER